MRILIFVFLCFCHSYTMAQIPTASQTAHDFYSWYLTKGVNVGWKQAVKRPELTVGFQKKLTVFFQKLEKDNEDKFTLNPIAQTASKATFSFSMFGQQTATVTLVNINNKWLIDNIQGVQ